MASDVQAPEATESGIKSGAYCCICKKPMLDMDPDKIYCRVIGFEIKREQGGTNHVRLRHRTGEVAHPHCIEMQAHKLDAGQESLL